MLSIGLQATAVLCQKMTSRPTAQYLPLLVFVAYTLICLTV